MPSRKVFSILIISSALVLAIILAKPKSDTLSTTGTLSTGPKVALVSNLPEGTDWQDTLSTLPAQKTLSFGTKATSTDTSNLTDTVSRSLMANYLALKQGDNLNTDSATKLVDQTINYIDNTNISKRSYTSVNILITTSNSTTTIKKYGNDIGAVSRYNKVPESDNPLAALNKVLETNEINNDLVIKQWATFYLTLEISVSKVSAPSSLTGEHLSLLNALAGMSSTVSDMSEINTDPLKSMRGVSNYPNSLNTLVAAVKNIQDKIRAYGISYEQSENGYYLYNNL